ncbi:hypothetical protein [Desulfovibrio litoralis]|uniref:Uncharacterized protein n=1 Tax=Desulfovibrio litoralis DSM 11393 TaxID=1121455 RepID=A0A1M7TCQ3_9BACT|nr:hypothetical protein [Desulfovibrio litoralis]SHN68466.1 hypothetical protein SAMN02745728_01832 [Desulfovibrio litoralis DSM 11393]
MADDLGYSVDLKYSIIYKIVDIKTSQIVFEKKFIVPTKKIGKFGAAESFANTASELILAGYELFITEPKVKMIIESNMNTDNNMIPHGKK